MGLAPEIPNLAPAIQLQQGWKIDFFEKKWILSGVYYFFNDAKSTIDSNYAFAEGSGTKSWRTTNSNDSTRPLNVAASSLAALVSIEALSSLSDSS